jgi:hypothetical protein
VYEYYINFYLYKRTTANPFPRQLLISVLATFNVGYVGGCGVMDVISGDGSRPDGRVEGEDASDDDGEEDEEGF